MIIPSVLTQNNLQARQAPSSPTDIPPTRFAV